MLEETKQRFGIAVKRKRKEHGMSQTELAEKLQLGARTVSEIECGRGNPKMDTVIALIEELKISFDEILNPPASTDIVVPQSLDQMQSECSKEELEMVTRLGIASIQVMRSLQNKDLSLLDK